MRVAIESTSWIAPLVLVLATGCGGNDQGSGGSGATGAANATAASTSGTATSVSSNATGGSTSSGPPDGCTELLPSAATSLQVADPEEYSFQPDVNATVSVGDPNLPDTFRLRLDGAMAVGTTPITSALTNEYGIYTGRLSVDFTSDGANGGTFAKVLYATSGDLVITSMINPWQSEGSVQHLRLDEGVFSAVDHSFSATPGGACYWVKSLSWNTKRTGGCAPFEATDPCGAGKYCMPTNSIGGDGLCVTTGAQTVGAACAVVPHPAGTTIWDSNCGPGLRCFQDSETNEPAATCHQICNPTSTTPGCGSSTHCGGGYDLCLPDTLLNGGDPHDGLDPTVVGATCDQASTDQNTTQKTYYCGGDARPGMCVNDHQLANGDEPPATCIAWARGVSECVAKGDIAGFIQYKGGNDESTIWCFPASKYNAP